MIMNISSDFKWYSLFCRYRSDNCEKYGFELEFLVCINFVGLHVEL